MKSLRDSLRKTLAHRHMGHQMIGAVALNTVRDFLGIQKHTKSIESVTSLNDSGQHEELMEFVDDRSGLEWHVRFKVLFLKTDDQALKIKIFQQKNQILSEINLALEKVGYATKIDTIRM